jgi:hypothetical protein
MADDRFIIDFFAAQKSLPPQKIRILMSRGKDIKKPCVLLRFRSVSFWQCKLLRIMGNSSSSSHKVSNGRDSKSGKKSGHNMSGNQGTADAMMQAQLEAEVL